MGCVGYGDEIDFNSDARSDWERIRITGRAGCLLTGYGYCTDTSRLAPGEKLEIGKRMLWL